MFDAISATVTLPTSFVQPQAQEAATAQTQQPSPRRVQHLTRPATQLASTCPCRRGHPKAVSTAPKKPNAVATSMGSTHDEIRRLPELSEKPRGSVSPTLSKSSFYPPSLICPFHHPPAQLYLRGYAQSCHDQLRSQTAASGIQHSRCSPGIQHALFTSSFTSHPDQITCIAQYPQFR